MGTFRRRIQQKRDAGMKQHNGRYAFPFLTHWLFLRVLAIVLLSEVVVMALLPMVFPGVHTFVTVVVDAALSVAFSAPLLWWFIFRPMRANDIAERLGAANIVESSIDGIITANDQGVVESFNPAAERLFGYTEEEALGKPLTILMPARYRETYDKGLERARSGAEFRASGETVELHGLRKNGSEFPLELSISTWQTRKGRVYAGIIRDITRRKHREKQIHLLNTAVESVANAIVITDREGSITWINPAFTALTGYTSAEVLGQNPRILKSGVQDRSLYRLLWEAILAGQVWKGELVNRRKDGSFYVEEQTITPLRDVNGEITSFIAVKQDITERKRAEEMERVRAQAANRLKAQLVSALAHDIKNPLGVILGYAESIESRLGNRPEAQDNLNALQRIEDNAERIVKLVTGFLDASRVESGKVELARQPVQLNLLVREVCRQQMGDLRSKNLSLRVDLHDPLPDMLGDEAQIDRVLWNLVGNAIKFTPMGGKITVISRVENAHVCVDVKDTGTGIPKDEQPLLFSEFRCLKGSAKVEGTGLGLFIVKTIVEAHGGKVGVESEEGKGATFSVRFPIPGS